MNFFFGLKVPELKCKITIPKFTNRTDEINNYNLFEAKISNNRWIISKKNCDENNNFYFSRYLITGSFSHFVCIFP